MFCKNCGSELRDGVLFCASCGREVGQGAPSLGDLEPGCHLISEDPIEAFSSAAFGHERQKRTILLAILAAVLVIAALAFALTRPKPSTYAGNYLGSSGSYLSLAADGSCVYSEGDSTGTGTGTYAVEGNTLTVNASNLGYPIHADISNFTNTLLMVSDASSWNDEAFVRQP